MAHIIGRRLFYVEEGCNYTLPLQSYMYIFEPKSLNYGSMNYLKTMYNQNEYCWVKSISKEYLKTTIFPQNIFLTIYGKANSNILVLQENLISVSSMLI